MEEISDRLREFREKVPMSQSELSRALNISRGGVNRWEKGDAHKMSLENAIRACAVLQVTVDELAHGTAPVGALDRAKLISMVYQLVAQGTEVKPALVTQLAAIIR